MPKLLEEFIPARGKNKDKTRHSIAPRHEDYVYMRNLGKRLNLAMPDVLTTMILFVQESESDTQ